MRSKRWVVGAVLCVLVAGAMAVHGAAATIVVENAWARPGFAGTPAPPSARGSMSGTMKPAAGGNSAVYLRLVNQGSADDRLVAATTPVANRVELHMTTIRNGIASMRSVRDIFVPAGGATELKPGSLHLMLVGLKQDLRIGDRIPLELRFTRGTVLKLTVDVKMMTE